MHLPNRLFTNPAFVAWNNKHLVMNLYLTQRVLRNHHFIIFAALTSIRLLKRSLVLFRDFDELR